jgi:hypothetical protein
LELCLHYWSSDNADSSTKSPPHNHPIVFYSSSSTLSSFLPQPTSHQTEEAWTNRSSHGCVRGTWRTVALLLNYKYLSVRHHANISNTCQRKGQD